MRACEWLARVRLASSRIEGLRRELSVLEDARRDCLPWTTRGSATHGSMGGTHSDPTATEAQARIEGLDERIADVRAACDECERIVGDCLRMLDIMRHELGERHADVIELYYVDRADTWSEVAWEMGVSRRTVCRMRDEAFVWIDCVCPRFVLS